MKKIGSIVIFVFCAVSCLLSQAQISLKAKAPQTIGVDEGFTIEYTVNSKNPSNFQPPAVSGATVVAGPYTSRSSNTTIINGRVSSSASTTFSFTLVAKKEGTVNITPAKVKVDNQIYASKSLRIQVVKNPTMAQRRGNQNNNSYDPFAQFRSQRRSQTQNQTPSTKNQTQSKQVQIDDKAIFVRVIPNKTDVVKGEEIVLTYKLYTLLPVSEYQIEKIPSTTGFWMEEMDNQPNPHLTVEMYNGQRYQVADLKKVIIFPQRSGALTIKPMALSVIAHIATRQRQNFSTGDPFFDQFLNDPFFSSFQTSYQSVKKKLYTNSLTFYVKDIPNKPDNYCGGVGKFTISGDISTKQAKAYEPFYLTYTLSGHGNLTLINNLPLDLPDELQLSDPEITDNLHRDASGLTGTRTFRYLVIPRVEGKFTIPDLNISYYNVDKRSFDSLTLAGYQIQVAKGDVNSDYANQLDNRLKYRNMKIKSQVSVSALDKEYHIFDKAWIYSIVAFLIIALGVMIALTMRYKRLSMDVANMKMKKSTKIAIRRLRKAKKFLDNNQMEAFEDETAIALWNYLEDRFKMDRTNLSIQGCKDELLSMGANSETVEKLGTILDRCQYLRFSQDKQATADITLYDDTVNVISSIEDQMKELKKNKKKQKSNKPPQEFIPKGLTSLLILVVSLLLTTISYSQNSKVADTTKALKRVPHKQIVVSAEQYCHIADSCFKQSDYANAMLYYEKALKLSPSNKDIRLNINITRSRLVGDTYIMPDFFLIRWAKYISGLVPLPIWAVLFIGLFVVACVMFFIYLFTQNRKALFFYLCLATLVLSLSSMGFGIVRQNIQNDNSKAIIMKSNTHLRQTKNTTAKDIVIMYKGQKITILENDGSGWLKAQTEDNKVGYMENKNYKRI